MRRLVLALTMMGLGGCATVPADPMVWIRTDGQRISGALALSQQLDIDKTVCLGHTQQSASNMQPVYSNGSIADSIGVAIINNQRQGTLMDVAKGCMAEKGYVQVPTSQAEAQLAEFAKTAKARAKAG